MGDHEHACLRNGTQQPHHHMVRIFPGGCHNVKESLDSLTHIVRHQLKGRILRFTCLRRWRVGVTLYMLYRERCLKWRVRPFVEAIPKQLGVERAVMCQPPFGGSGITAQPRLLPVVVSTSAPSEMNRKLQGVTQTLCLDHFHIVCVRDSRTRHTVTMIGRKVAPL